MRHHLLCALAAGLVAALSLIPRAVHAEPVVIQLPSMVATLRGGEHRFFISEDSLPLEARMKPLYMELGMRGIPGILCGGDPVLPEIELDILPHPECPASWGAPPVPIVEEGGLYYFNLKPQNVAAENCGDGSPGYVGRDFIVRVIVRPAPPASCIESYPQVLIYSSQMALNAATVPAKDSSWGSLKEIFQP